MKYTPSHSLFPEDSFQLRPGLRLAQPQGTNRLGFCPLLSLPDNESRIQLSKLYNFVILHDGQSPKRTILHKKLTESVESK
jgi:hypothetical protein